MLQFQLKLHACEGGIDSFDVRKTEFAANFGKVTRQRDGCDKMIEDSGFCSSSSWSREASQCVASVDRTCSAHIDAVTVLDAVTYGHLQTRWSAPPSPAPRTFGSSRHARAPDDSQPDVSAAAASSAMSITIGLRVANVDAINHFSPRHGTQSTARCGRPAGRLGLPAAAAR